MSDRAQTTPITLDAMAEGIARQLIDAPFLISAAICVGVACQRARSFAGDCAMSDGPKETTANEISVTLEMIKAGTRAYILADERVQSDEEIVSEIYRAMEAARAK